MEAQEFEDHLSCMCVPANRGGGRALCSLRAARSAVRSSRGNEELLSPTRSPISTEETFIQIKTFIAFISSIAFISFIEAFIAFIAFIVGARQ